MISLTAVAGFVQKIKRTSIAGATLAAISVLAVGGVAQAGYDTTGSSSGVAISSNLSILSLVTADVSVNPLAGTAPTAYNSSSTLAAGATINSGGFLTGTLLTGGTGLLTTSVASTVNGSATNASASGSTLINNLNLSVLSTLVTIGASSLNSSSTITGTYGALTPGDSTSFTGLSIKVLGIDVTAAIEASAGVAVNIGNIAGLSSVAGLTIGLDVSTTTGNGTSTSTVTTDNIIVNFSGVNVLGLTGINGSLIVGQSIASMQATPGTAVPEPSSIAMVGVGLLLSGVAGARRRNRRVAG